MVPLVIFRETHLRHVIHLIVSIITGDTVSIGDREDGPFTAQESYNRNILSIIKNKALL